MDTDLTHKLILEDIQVPTLPDVVLRLQGLLDDPAVDIERIAEAIAQDPPIAARVLSIANSTLYGQREPVAGIRTAVLVLGTNLIREVVLQAAIIEAYRHLSDETGFDIEELWRHSIQTARIARTVALRVRAELELHPETCYACGLLHDLGKIVLLDSRGEGYLRFLGAEASGERPAHELESEQFGYNHAQVGGAVATVWELPEDIVAAIEFHHGPESVIESSPPVCATSFANELANRIRTEPEVEAESLLAGPARNVLGLSRKAAAEILESALESWRAIQAWRA